MAPFDPLRMTSTSATITTGGVHLHCHVRQEPPDEPPFPNAIDVEVVPPTPLLTQGAARDAREAGL